MKRIIFFFVVILGLFTAQSCKKDEVADVKGCTDAEAENYDPLANVAGDCTYARDKFIGTYKGTLTCPGGLALLSGQTTFTIDEDITGGKNDVTVLITTNTGLVVPVKGVCAGSKLSIDQVLKGLTIDLLGSPVVVDITVKGEVTYTEASKTLAGNLALNTKGVVIPIDLSDTCPITGVKQ
ncbi:MAG: hypothetical protein IPN29_12620 [Saprospiraceae bacterium]|nr:hypothetical protein [Saprospiraceae bacterium]